MRILGPKFVLELYRQVFRRNASSEEISRFIYEQALNASLPERIGSMINSKEFEIMIMPELVRKATEEYQGGQVFFLHVPKTAGTSIRLALSDAMGIPSYNIYRQTSHQPPTSPTAMHFWPLWAGHANLHFFPGTHVGLTIFRESRSRILSRFRQSQFESSQLNPHLMASTNKADRKKRHSESPSFNQWIQKNFYSIASWYVPNSDSMRDAPSWRTHVRGMSEIDLSRNLETSLKRFSAAAWIHHPEHVHRAIEKVTGKEVNALPKANEFKATNLFKEESIDKGSLQILKEIERQDSIVFKVASELGILIGELEEDEDAIFDVALQRLGFKLE